MKNNLQNLQKVKILEVVFPCKRQKMKHCQGFVEGGRTQYPRRAGACVKSNIVNNLCKDMVYTFWITNYSFGKPSGA